ncbi:hypothetical protein J6590_026518 [Homalodisca vitripennis]|nr:hypothetical protein J6590_026518 [Homalodisca vitripennis]
MSRLSDKKYHDIVCKNVFLSRKLPDTSWQVDNDTNLQSDSTKCKKLAGQGVNGLGGEWKGRAGGAGLPTINPSGQCQGERQSQLTGLNNYLGNNKSDPRLIKCAEVREKVDSRMFVLRGGGGRDSRKIITNGPSITQDTLIYEPLPPLVHLGFPSPSIRDTINKLSKPCDVSNSRTVSRCLGPLNLKVSRYPE